MLQVFHLDVSKIDIGEAHVLLLVRCRGSPCHHGSPHAPAGATIAACMRARETEHAQGGPHACVGPRGLQSRMGVGVRELARVREHHPSLARRIGRSGASKSVFFTGLRLSTKIT